MKKIFLLFTLLFVGFSSSYVLADECGCKLRIGLEERPFSIVIPREMPNGFEIKSHGIGQNIYLQYDFADSRFSLKLSAEIIGVDERLKYNDSSLDEINIRNQVLTGKYNLFPNPVCSFNLGFGILYADRDGSYSIGNYKFPTTGNHWSPIAEGSLEFPLDEDLALSLSLQVVDINLTTTIPNVGDVSYRVTGSLLFGIYQRFQIL